VTLTRPGALKILDVKWQDVKQTDEISGHEIAGHENARHLIAGRIDIDMISIKRRHSYCSYRGYRKHRR